MTWQEHTVEINHSPNWLYIPDQSYRILIIGGSVKGKSNVLLSLIKHQQPDTDKIYLYVKDPFESKYQLLNNGREIVGIKILRNSKAFTDYLQTINDVYESLEDLNLTKERGLLIVSLIVTKLLLGERKLNVSLVFISKSYFKVPKTRRLHATHHFIMRIPKKRELQQKVSNKSSILKIS